MNKLTTEEFIKRAKEVHGDKYDYSKTEYINARTKICIIYPGHGEFWQKPFDHLNGHGGMKYRNPKPCDTTEQFIEKARIKHGEKYDYSKVIYINAHTKVCIICPEHGEFWITPNKHLNGGGCQICSKINKTLKATLSVSEFIEKVRKVHGDRYDYSKVDYKGNKRKVCIICPEHGEFWMTPNSHLNGQRCPKCSMPNYGLTTSEFIEKARKIHGDRYDYSKVDYKGMNVKVCIICPEHGEFWQKPTNHILFKHGCSLCNISKLERNVELMLLKNDIKFERQKRFNWLKLQSLDFYLPDYNIAIECQGIQHFEPVDYFGGVDNFEYVKSLDCRKNKLCNEHKIRIIYFSNLKCNEDIIIDEDILLHEIKQK